MKKMNSAVLEGYHSDYSNRYRSAIIVIKKLCTDKYGNTDYTKVGDGLMKLIAKCKKDLMNENFFMPM